MLFVPIIELWILEESTTVCSPIIESTISVNDFIIAPFFIIELPLILTNGSITTSSSIITSLSIFI